MCRDEIVEGTAVADTEVEAEGVDEAVEDVAEEGEAFAVGCRGGGSGASGRRS